MKRWYQYTIVCVLFLLMAGCHKKKYDDALPKVSIVSITQYHSDSVTITGRVDSRGAKPIQYVGFAYSPKDSFSVLERQQMLDAQTGEFTAIVRAFQDSTYYFKAFAANSFGYSTSETVKFTVPHAAPATAPCTIPNNTLIDDGNNVALTNFYSGAPYATYGSFGVEAYGASRWVHVEFNKIPVNGIYTTQNYATMSNGMPGDVYVTINGNQVQTGVKVYVSENGAAKTISFCNMLYYGFTTYSADARFTF